MYTNSSLIPSPKDLILVLPRLAQRAGAFAFYTVPEHLDDIIGKMRYGGSVIAESTIAEKVNATASNTTKAFFRSAVGGSSQTAITAASATAASSSPVDARAISEVLWSEGLFSFQTLRNMGGMFSYLMTRWALGTFVVVSTIA
jgi:hypothetical protein